MFHRVGDQGEAVQVDPFKLKLKPPGAKRLKLKCDTLLSTSAFNFFKLHRYIKDLFTAPTVVGRCRLTPGLTRVERAWFRRLRLNYDVPLSDLDFNPN
jgi:hypothetical protein